jgi:hypothetical protein
VKSVTEEQKNNAELRAQTQEILRTISSEIPLMIKNILALVFSEDSGRTLGKAAAAYYKELKNGGLPEEVAIKLTQDYMHAFTSLADLALPEKLRGMKNKESTQEKRVPLRKVPIKDIKKKKQTDYADE